MVISKRENEKCGKLTFLLADFGNSDEVFEADCNLDTVRPWSRHVHHWIRFTLTLAYRNLSLHFDRINHRRVLYVPLLRITSTPNATSRNASKPSMLRLLLIARLATILGSLSALTSDFVCATVLRVEQ